MKTNIHLRSYFPHFFLKWEIFQIKFGENIKTHAMFIFLKPCRFWDVKKYGRARQATDGIIRRLRHIYILRICNPYCFSTATVVTRTRLDVTLYVHCPSCSSYVLSAFTFPIHILLISKIAAFSNGPREYVRLHVLTWGRKQMQLVTWNTSLWFLAH
jgi:hypothetical protein